MPTSTYQPKNSTVVRKWHLIDANDMVLGRLATQVSRLLAGKSKSTFAPHVDCGDFVVIINAEGVRITGNNKPTQKIDFRHSGFPGGDTMTPYGEFMRKNPERAVQLAVSGMLAKTRLRKRQIARLRVYRGKVHPHGAQIAVAQPAQPAGKSS
jgi:large subunit ribosomal protein L13